MHVSTRRPCCLYAHCNSGSRRDAEEALYVLLPHNVTVFCLDFAVRHLRDLPWLQTEDPCCSMAILRQQLTRLRPALLPCRGRGCQMVTG